MKSQERFGFFQRDCVETFVKPTVNGLQQGIGVQGVSVTAMMRVASPI